MTSGKVKTRLIVLFIWIVFASIAALSLKYFFVPKIEEVKREANVKAQKELVEKIKIEGYLSIKDKTR